MSDIKKKLGQRIQEVRKSRKLTQDKMAELIGIEPTNFSKIETGKNYPTSENLQKIADALCVEVHELFEFDEDKNSILLDKIYKRIEVHKNNKQKLVELYKILQALD